MRGCDFINMQKLKVVRITVIYVKDRARERFATLMRQPKRGRGNLNMDFVLGCHVVE